MVVVRDQRVVDVLSVVWCSSMWLLYVTSLWLQARAAQVATDFLELMQVSDHKWQPQVASARPVMELSKQQFEEWWFAKWYNLSHPFVLQPLCTFAAFPLLGSASVVTFRSLSFLLKLQREQLHCIHCCTTLPDSILLYTIIVAISVCSHSLRAFLQPTTS